MKKSSKDDELMSFEQRLVQSQTQKLVLSPQIKQYIKLLPLPILELQQSVEHELVENPALEEDTAYDQFDEDNHDQSEDNSAQDDAELDFQEKMDQLEKIDDEFKETLYSEYSNSRLEDREELEKRKNYQDSIVKEHTNLIDFLINQIKFLSLTKDDRKIAEAIVGNIDNNGYFIGDPQGIADELETEIEDVEAVLMAVQTLDPSGVAARNLQECLLIQLRNREDAENTELATRIIKETFHLLEKRDYPAITRFLKEEESAVLEAIEQIRSLEPKPARDFSGENVSQITPDASVYPAEPPEKGYVIEIHDERIPRLKINRQYKRMLKDKDIDKKTKDYLKSKINGAFWFIQALEQRKTTLRGITEEIVKAQEDFFERGFAFLRPLRLKDISAKLSVHESTVSRAISGKYINTPQGTYAYKVFFSNKMETSDGSDESQKSVMEKIRMFIDNEDPAKPYSDSKLVRLLENEGIKIARRTVAKYRELLKILPSHMRRQK